MTREEWDDCDDAGGLMIVVSRAHVRGAITRRRLVQVMLRCVEWQAYLLPQKALTALADLTAWAHGAVDVDLADVRGRLFAVFTGIEQRKLGPAAFAVSVAYAAIDAEDLHAGHYASNAAFNAGDASAALCDVIRDEIAFDEVKP